MGKDAPKAPDPAQVAGGQLKWGKRAAQDTLKLNAMDQTGPFGSSTFNRNAKGVPVGITSEFAPELQGAAQNVMGNMGAQTGLLPAGPFNPNVDAAGIRNALYSNAMMQAEPEWRRQDKLREIRMAERGLPIGSEAWDDAEDQVAEARNQFMRGASNDSWLAGAQEEQRQRGNALQDYMLPYQTAGQNLGLLSGMKGLTPIANQPQASIMAPDYAGNAWNAYNAQQDQYNSEMGGLGQLVSTGLGLLTAPMTGGMSLMGAAGAPTLLGSMTGYHG